MRWNHVLILLTALSVTGTAPSAADTSPPATADGGTSWHEHPYQGPGPVRIPAGHMDTAGGIVVLGARDNLWWHAMNTLPFNQQVIGGIICQVPPGADACPPIPDLADSFAFCHGVTLHDGENWDPSLDTIVWIGGFDQLAQTPGNAWCENPRPATTGVITHWPGH